MSEDTFFSYKNYRWLWLNTIAVTLMIAIYLIDRPLGGPSGGTILGLTYGVIGALGILYLTWFGIRKRSYHAQQTTLKGCLSAHVWLGLALLIIVPLHAGFQFGWNVHSLAFVLMTLVILSGLWGARHYQLLAPTIRSHRGGAQPLKLLEQIESIGQDIEAKVKEVEARGDSASFNQLVAEVDFDYKPSIWKSLFDRTPELESENASKLLAGLQPAQQEAGLALISLADKKRDVARELEADVATLTKLRVWLYLHVPLTIALLIALLIHILSVFYYR